MVYPRQLHKKSEGNKMLKKMKKTKLALFACAAVSVSFVAQLSTVAMAADFSPKAGLYYKKEVGDVVFHTYTSPIKYGASASVVIETPEGLIIQDVQQNKPQMDDLKALVDSLEKPLKRVYLSHGHDHHYLGLETFAGLPVYARTSTTEHIEAEGEKELAAAKDKFGDMVPYTKVVVPNYEIKDGEEVVAGVKIVNSVPFMSLTGPCNFMSFPDQKVIIGHHLAYNGVHVPMPGTAPRIEAVKKLQNDGYEYVIGGHGIPSDIDEYVAETVAYNTKLAEVVKSSKNVAEAKAKMMEAYPNWGGVFLLDKILPAHFAKK